MDLELKELLAIISNAIKYYNNFPSNNKFLNSDKKIDNTEVIALAYYHAVVQYLNRKGCLDLTEVPLPKFVIEDSQTKEDDYTHD